MTEQEWLACDDPARLLKYIVGHNANLAEGVGGGRPVSDRQLRLFACACARQVWDLLKDDAPCGRCEEFNNQRRYDPTISNPGHKCRECGSPIGTGRVNRSRKAVEVAERYADGLATAGDMDDEAIFIGPHPERGLAARCCWDNAASGATEVCEILSRHGWLTAAEQGGLLRDIVGNPFDPVQVNVHKRPRENSIWIYDWENMLGWNGGAVERLAREMYDSRDFTRMPILADALEEAGCDNVDILNHCRGKSRHHESVTATHTCPECGSGGHWRSGVGFEHEMIHACADGRWTTWEPGKPYLKKSWREGGVHHVRGCWVIDLILGRA